MKVKLRDSKSVEKKLAIEVDGWIPDLANTEHIVYAVKVFSGKRGGTWFLICPGENLRRPYYIPCEIFDIVDSTISPNWIIKVFGDNYQDRDLYSENQMILLYLGPLGLDDSTLHAKVLDDDPGARAKFHELAQLSIHELN